MIGREFLSAGRAVFTVDVPEEWARRHGAKAHYTYRINRKKGGSIYFVSVGSEYGSPYLGKFIPNQMRVLLTRNSQYDNTSWEYRILKSVLRAIAERRENDILAVGWNVMHQGKCGKCSRPLDDPESIARGIGPKCWARMGL